MSQDPNSAYGNDPQNPYGAPQNPYGTPPQGTPPQGGPSGPPPPTPYGNPPQGGQYGAAPQTPYGAPPQGTPYGAPGYGMAPQQAAEVPMGVAIQQLPQQYIKVLTRPSRATFEEELPKAGWNGVWLQLGIYTAAVVVLGIIGALLASVAASAVLSSNPTLAPFASYFSAGTTVAGALYGIITVSIVFFIGVGIQFGLAKMFGGQGTFVGQSYTTLLYQVPLRAIGLVIGVLLSLIPVLGALINIPIGIALFAYAIVLNVFQIQASHRLSGGRAVAVVLIPYAVVFVLLGLCALAFASLFLQIIRSAQPH